VTPHVIVQFAAAAALALLTAQPALAQPPAPAERSFALEADALAYPLGGYSGIFRVSLANGFNVALGTGRFDVPEFLLEGQDSFDAAGWKATSESIQVLRVGYRFGKANANGLVLDAIVINQKWKLTAEKLNTSTSFRPLGVGVSSGYYLHLGRHFYVYPTVSLTWNGVYDGSTTVQGLDYKVARLQLNGSVHVGWEWRF
jgi:hypothetical protein